MPGSLQAKHAVALPPGTPKQGKIFPHLQRLLNTFIMRGPLQAKQDVAVLPGTPKEATDLPHLQRFIALPHGTPKKD